MVISCSKAPFECSRCRSQCARIQRRFCSGSAPSDGSGGGSWLCSPRDVHGFCGEHSDPLPRPFVVKVLKLFLIALIFGG